MGKQQGSGGMNRDDVIRLVREAGMIRANFTDRWDVHQSELEKFAALVAAAEREACARMCEVEYAACWHNSAMAAAKAAERCATAIRLRGGK